MGPLGVQGWGKTKGQKFKHFPTKYTALLLAGINQNKLANFSLTLEKFHML